MFRHLVSCAGLLAVLMLAAPARATIAFEDFENPSYVPGNALSDFYFDQQDATGGALDIESVGGDHGQVVKLTGNGPANGASFPSLTAKSPTADWGGPGRANGQLWFAVDIEQGVGVDTPLGTNIWNMSFIRPNGTATILSMIGGLGTFQVRPNGGATMGGVINLAPGWNQIAVLSDINSANNGSIYLNGALVSTFNLVGGAWSNAASSVGSVTLGRTGRGGPSDPFVGTMRFDNILAADENILVPEPSTFVLAGLGLVSLLFVRRRLSG